MDGRRASSRVATRTAAADAAVVAEAAAREAATRHGPWTAEDDLLLVQAVQQTQDPTIVAREVRFSRPRSARAIRERWTALLRDPVVSRYAGTQRPSPCSSSRADTRGTTRTAVNGSMGRTHASAAVQRLADHHVHVTELSPTNVPWSDDEVALLMPAVLRAKVRRPVGS